MMKIGILGGTFDPVHLGHLIVAEEVRIRLGLSEILFVPAGQPWLKIDHAVTAAVHRVEMVRRAIAGNPNFKLCTLEIERPGLSYTVDTITALRERLGAQSFFFILGSDTLAEFHLWKDPDKLVRMCQLVVMPRVGLSLSGLNSLEAHVPGVIDRVIKLNVPVIDISSSKIRQYVSQGLSVRYLVSDDVEEYISEHKLYRKGKAQGAGGGS